MRLPPSFPTLAVAVFLAGASLGAQESPKALPGIPANLSIEFGWGDSHAERGRQTIRLSADGTLVHGTSGHGKQTTARSQVGAAELQAIIKLIEDNRFFELDAEYRNPATRAG